MSIDLLCVLSFVFGGLTFLQLRILIEWKRFINICLNLLFFPPNIRYKGKSYRATVEIVRTADRVADFCRKTCIKLECCPNLFGPRMVLERCSENCSVLTKTKYSRWFTVEVDLSRKSNFLTKIEIEHTVTFYIIFLPSLQTDSCDRSLKHYSDLLSFSTKLSHFFFFPDTFSSFHLCCS